MPIGVDSALGGYFGRTITKTPNWHGLIAFELLVSNLACGLFLAAALSELALPHVFTRVLRVAYPLALALFLLDLCLLIADLGDPSRFHHMLRVFKPQSPMSLGTWSLVLSSFLLTIMVLTHLLPEDWIWAVWTRKVAAVIVLLPALASTVYKGVLFSTTAQPGWRDARWLAGYLASSAVMLGSAEMLILALWLGEATAVERLRAALAILLVLNLVPLGLLIRELRPTLLRHSPRPQGLRVGLFIFAGTLMPVFLLSRSLPAIWGAIGIVLFASAVARIIIVRIPHWATSAEHSRS
jgi:hypothetical protein